MYATGDAADPGARTDREEEVREVEAVALVVLGDHDGLGGDVFGTLLRSFLGGFRREAQAQPPEVALQPVEEVLRPLLWPILRYAGTSEAPKPVAIAEAMLRTIVNAAVTIWTCP